MNAPTATATINNADRSQVMTRAELYALPIVETWGAVKDFRFLVGVVLPDREMNLHESGFMAFSVACFVAGEVRRYGGGCDVLYRLPEHTSFDVLPNGLLRFFGHGRARYFEIHHVGSEFEVRHAANQEAP